MFECDLAHTEGEFYFLTRDTTRKSTKRPEAFHRKKNHLKIYRKFKRFIRESMSSVTMCVRKFDTENIRISLA